MNNSNDDDQQFNTVTARFVKEKNAKQSWRAGGLGAGDKLEA
jgi:hypothetical protein